MARGRLLVLRGAAGRGVAMKRKLINGQRPRMNRTSPAGVKRRKKMRERRYTHARPGAPFVTPAQLRTEAERRKAVYEPKPEKVSRPVPSVLAAVFRVFARLRGKGEG